MKLIHLSTRPPVYNGQKIKYEFNKNNDLILSSESRGSIEIKNAFGAEGLPRMAVFSTEPIYGSAFLVEAWYEHSRGATSLSVLALVVIKENDRMRLIWSLRLNRALTYTCVYDAAAQKLLFLSANPERSFSQSGNLENKGHLNFQAPFKIVDIESQKVSDSKHVTAMIHKIQGDLQNFQTDLPLQLTMIEDQNNVAVIPEIYSAYHELFSIDAEPILLDSLF